MNDEKSAEQAGAVLVQAEKSRDSVHKIYLHWDDVDSIYRRCDLGDSTTVHAYQYPHKDDLPEMICFERKI